MVNKTIEILGIYYFFWTATLDLRHAQLPLAETLDWSASRFSFFLFLHLYLELFVSRSFEQRKGLFCGYIHSNRGHLSLAKFSLVQHTTEITRRVSQVSGISP